MPSETSPNPIGMADLVGGVLAGEWFAARERLHKFFSVIQIDKANYPQAIAVTLLKGKEGKESRPVF